MCKNNKFNLCISIGFLLVFIVWTLLICFVDVRAVGPNDSMVGFATINLHFHKLIGVNMSLYVITDWLGLVPIFFVASFAVFGLVQWIKRKQISKVDYDILALGVFYLVVSLVYLLFEYLIINYRPILINGVLEVSYPSSTTLLAVCVIPTVIMQFDLRIKNNLLKKCINIILSLFLLFMVAGRLVSGVHWLTDIIGGTLLGAGLVSMYKYIINNEYKHNN